VSIRELPPCSAPLALMVKFTSPRRTRVLGVAAGGEGARSLKIRGAEMDTSPAEARMAAAAAIFEAGFIVL
jgi:hypothetical protein